MTKAAKAAYFGSDHKARPVDLVRKWGPAPRRSTSSSPSPPPSGRVGGQKEMESQWCCSCCPCGRLYLAARRTGGRGPLHWHAGPESPDPHGRRSRPVWGQGAAATSTGSALDREPRPAGQTKPGPNGARRRPAAGPTRMPAAGPGARTRREPRIRPVEPGGPEPSTPPVSRRRGRPAGSRRGGSRPRVCFCCTVNQVIMMRSCAVEPGG